MDNNSMAIRKLKFHMAGRNPQIVPCLVGPTGIGKTAIVKQVAKELGAELVYFNMAQQNQGDNALPVPHINAGQTLVQYALHHKFQEILDNPYYRPTIKKGYLALRTEFENTVELLDENGVTIDPEYYVSLDLFEICKGRKLIN